MLFRFNDLDRTFDLFGGLHRALAQPGGPQEPRPTLNPFNWGDTPEHYTLTADLPGVIADNLEITVQDEVLSVTAKRALTVPEGYRAHRVERRPFEIRRSFALPGKVDPDRIEAKLVDGVLTLKLAKVEPEGPRQITVTVG